MSLVLRPSWAMPPQPLLPRSLGSVSGWGTCAAGVSLSEAPTSPLPTYAILGKLLIAGPQSPHL